jgi:hypothetical protein
VTAELEFLASRKEPDYDADETIETASRELRLGQLADENSRY